MEAQTVIYPVGLTAHVMRSLQLSLVACLLQGTCIASALRSGLPQTMCVDTSLFLVTPSGAALVHCYVPHVHMSAPGLGAAPPATGSSSP